MKQDNLSYVMGDATLPPLTDPKELRVIAHVCNTVNKWGKGFVVPLGQRYPGARTAYLKAASQAGKHLLGSVTWHLEDKTLLIVNMVAQEGIKGRGGPLIRYDALAECLKRTVQLIQEKAAPYVSVHMPRIGCGLGGGDWKTVEAIIKRELCPHVSRCVVYHLPEDE